jgi:hypothetical protein
LLRQYGADVDHVTALDPEGLGAFLAEGARFEPEPSLRTAPGVTLITDAPITPANRAAVEEHAARATVIWITPWGLDEPWVSWPATDLCLHAAGGWMAAVGDPGRPPLAPPGAQARFVAGLYAAVEALASPALGRRSTTRSHSSTTAWLASAWGADTRASSRYSPRSPAPTDGLGYTWRSTASGGPCARSSVIPS